MGYSIRIKLKSIKHFKRCCEALKECDVQLHSVDIDELKMHRTKKYGWLYIGSNRVGWVFFSKSIVKYSKPMKLEDVITMYQRGCICCPISTD